MKDDTRKRLSELILEELSEKMRGNENLRRKLEPFTDLPVEKVADAIMKQFEYLLSSDLRDLIMVLVEREVGEAAGEPAIEEKVPPVIPSSPIEELPAKEPEEVVVDEDRKASPSESIMQHFGPKEPFPTLPMDIQLKPNDWFYLYGFSYAPDSTGKGVPTRKLGLKGADGTNEVFMLDYGDVRLYLNKIKLEDCTLDKAQRPTLMQQKVQSFKFEHERVLNTLRTEDVIVPLPFWSVMQSLVEVNKQVEDKYVELLKTLIDIHDVAEWDVEVFAFDQHLIELPSIAEASKGRISPRESRHPTSRGKDIKVLEKLIMKEKNFAQDIHSQLLIHSSKAKIDFMIRLDNAFMEDWKSILAARYTVGKDKRKIFCQTISNVEEEYKEYQLMVRVTNPTIRFTFVPR